MRIFSKKQSGKKDGFTLVEMIVYTAFVAVLGLVAIQATLTMMTSFYMVRLSRNINESAVASLERMSREIRNAYNVNTTLSVFGTSPGTLYLNTKDISGLTTTVEFYVLDGVLRVKEGGVDKGPLFAKGVTVSSLIFRNITTTNSKAIKIEMALADTRGVLAQSFTVYDTIQLRGSAH